MLMLFVLEFSMHMHMAYTRTRYSYDRICVYSRYQQAPTVIIRGCGGALEHCFRQSSAYQCAGDNVRLAALTRSRVAPFFGAGIKNSPAHFSLNRNSFFRPPSTDIMLVRCVDTKLLIYYECACLFTLS